MESKLREVRAFNALVKEYKWTIYFGMSLSLIGYIVSFSNIALFKICLYISVSILSVWIIGTLYALYLYIKAVLKVK